MELTLPAATLAREMSLMQGVVERRTPHQILSNVLLEARDQTLTLTATDLDTTFVSEIESLSLKTSGAVTVPARRLFDVVRDLPPAAEVRLRVLENHHVQIDCKEPKLRIRLNGLPATDFPTRPEAAGGPTLTLKFGALRRMVEKVRFAVSTEEIRLQLQGALLKPKDGGLEMAATDGHRLALIEVEDATAEDGLRGDPRLQEGPRRALATRRRRRDPGHDRPRNQPHRLHRRAPAHLLEARRPAVPRLREGHQQGQHEEGDRRPRGASRRGAPDLAPLGRPSQGGQPHVQGGGARRLLGKPGRRRRRSGDRSRVRRRHDHPSSQLALPRAVPRGVRDGQGPPLREGRGVPVPGSSRGAGARA